PSSDGSPRNLASIGRELTANDWQQIAQQPAPAGNLQDRNTELQLPAPFLVPAADGQQVNASLLPSENFNELSAPNLPGGWRAVIVTGRDNWVTQQGASSLVAHAVDTPSNSDKYFESPVFVPPANKGVSFTQTVDLEQSYDGAALEISINNGAYQDISAAGGQ